MVKSFRFLLSFAWVNLGVLIAFAAIIVGGCYLTGVPDSPDASNLFVTYYAMFPAMILLCLFLYAFGLCTSNLNLGLSMGARRGDFFLALQAVMVFYAAVCWILQLFMSALPAVANWAVRDRWDLLAAYDSAVWVFPLLSFVILVLGCISGLVMVKNRALGTVLIMISVFVLLGATVFLILSSETGMFDFLTGPRWAWLDKAPRILAGVLAAAFAGSELLIWRTIQRYTVR